MSSSQDTFFGWLKNFIYVHSLICYGIFFVFMINTGFDSVLSTMFVEPFIDDDSKGVTMVHYIWFAGFIVLFGGKKIKAS